MGTLTWVVLRPILIAVLTQFFGTMVASWFDRLLPSAEKLDKDQPMPQTMAASTGQDAVYQFGEYLKHTLYDLIDRYVQRRFVAVLLKKVVDLIQGAVLNAVWDALFKKGVVAQPVVMSAVDSIVPAKFDLSEAEIRTMDEEVDRVAAKLAG